MRRFFLEVNSLDTVDHTSNININFIKILLAGTYAEPRKKNILNALFNLAFLCEQQPLHSSSTMGAVVFA